MRIDQPGNTSHAKKATKEARRAKMETIFVTSVTVDATSSYGRGVSL